MPEVKGFRAYRYQEDRVDSLDRVITPPFDVISPEERCSLMQTSPYNLVHLILPEAKAGLDPYQSAAGDYRDFIARGVLARDVNESFYLLKQTFRDLEGRQHVRRGFFGVTKIPEAGEDSVLGHERTFAKKIEDRLALTKAAEANFGAVFVLYSDRQHDLRSFLDTMETRPEDDLAHTIDGVTQQIWRVDHDPCVTAFFRDKRLYIADGHHRFATACAYRDFRRAQEKPEGPRPYDYVLMGYVDVDDPGLLVYPTHRVLDLPSGFEFNSFIERLKPWFEVVPGGDDLSDQVRDAAGCVFGLAVQGQGRWRLTLRDADRVTLLGADRGPAWRELDVAVLHRGIIERILGLPEGSEFTYEHSATQALASVERGPRGMAFLLKSTPARQILACAEAREFMPQKTTYIYPKLPSGAAINPL